MPALQHPSSKSGQNFRHLPQSAQACWEPVFWRHHAQFPGSRARACIGSRLLALLFSCVNTVTLTCVLQGVIDQEIFVHNYLCSALER